MSIEYEVTILEIDKDSFEEKLISLGAKKRGSYFQKRYCYDFKPRIYGKWIRLRTNGEKTEFAIKEVFDKNIVGGTNETEVEVSSFEDTHNIIQQMGYEPRTYQENRRIIYDYENIEICIDEWPMIPIYAEVEGKNEKDVYDFIKKLDIEDKYEVTTIDVTSIYNKYGIDPDKYEILKFD